MNGPARAHRILRDRTQSFLLNRASRPWRFTVKLTPGKLAGMKAVSNDRGVIAAAAMDQRGSLKKALGADAGDAAAGRVQDLRHRSSHPARQRHPARSRVGPARRQAPRQGLRPAAGLREDRLRQAAARPPARPARPVVRQAPEGSRRRLRQDPALLHAVRRCEDQRPQARLDRAHRRRVPRQRHSVLPRAGRLQGRHRREGPRVRQAEARVWSPSRWRSSPRTATTSTC